MGIFDVFRSDVLYFPGCINYFKFNKGFQMYQHIFSRLGIKFRVFDSYVCCGLEPFEAGYENEARKLARENFNIFREEGINNIITTSPGCYKMFLQNYSEIMPDWDISVVNIWGLVLDKLKERHNLIKNKAMEVVTFHDSCYLGRYCGIYEEPRKILELIGYQIKEMDNSRESSFCCGSCGGLPIVDSKLAGKVAKERILQAKRIGVRTMIVVGFDNYSLLSANVNNNGIEILEFSDVLGNALGIREFEQEMEREDDILLETKANIRLEEEFKEEDYLDEIKEDDWK